MLLTDFASLKCSEPSTDDLLLIAYDLGASWKMFGRMLNLDKPQLEQIEEDERKLIEKSYGGLLIVVSKPLADRIICMTCHWYRDIQSISVENTPEILK